MRLMFELALKHIQYNKNSMKLYSIIIIVMMVLLTNYAGVNAVREVMTRSAKEVVTGDVLACNEDYNFSLLGSKTDAPAYIHSVSTFASEINKNDHVEKVLTRLNASAVLESEVANQYVTLIGIESAKESISLIEGDWDGGENRVYFTTSLMESLDVSIGDTVNMFVNGAAAQFTTISCVVGGVFDNGRFGFMRTSHALIELSDVQEILGFDDIATHCMIYTDGVGYENFRAMVDGIDQDVKYLSSRESADLIYSIQDGMSVVMIVMVFIMTFISVVIIMNLSLFYLKHQAKEIAILKALGTRNGFIMGTYLLESFLQTLTLGSIAALVSYVIVEIVGAVGIYIGGGQKLFGDTHLILSLSGGQIFGTLGLLVAAALAANVISLIITLKRTQVRILQ